MCCSILLFLKATLSFGRGSLRFQVTQTENITPASDYPLSTPRSPTLLLPNSRIMNIPAKRHHAVLEDDDNDSCGNNSNGDGYCESNISDKDADGETAERTSAYRYNAPPPTAAPRPADPCEDESIACRLRSRVRQRTCRESVGERVCAIDKTESSGNDSSTETESEPENESEANSIAEPEPSCPRASRVIRTSTSLVSLLEAREITGRTLPPLFCRPARALLRGLFEPVKSGTCARNLGNRIVAVRIPRFARS